MIIAMQATCDIRFRFENADATLDEIREDIAAYLRIAKSERVRINSTTVTVSEVLVPDGQVMEINT